MKLAAVVEFPRNITIYLVIVIVTDAGGGNCVFVAIFIIRSLCVGRLRGALGLRVIGCRVWCNGILVRLILASSLFWFSASSLVVLSTPVDSPEEPPPITVSSAETVWASLAMACEIGGMTSDSTRLKTEAPHKRLPVHGASLYYSV